MEKKVIFFVIDTLETGGAERSILDIAAGFTRYDRVVCHIYPGNALKDEYEARGIQVISLNVAGHYNFTEAAKALQQTLQQWRPVLVHSTLFRSDFICRRVCRKLGIPLVNSLVNNSYTPDRYSKLSWTGRIKLRIVQWMDRSTARRADHFVSNSVTIKHTNAQALAMPVEKISVIYRGRNGEAYETRRQPAGDLRATLGLPVHATLLLNVSRLLDRKGQLDLLGAMARLAPEMPDVFLVIAGEGPHRPVLESEIANAGLKDRVFLLGNRSDIPDLLEQASLFVFPSHYEGLPGALIEAMMAGKTIVASDIPENLECVNEGSAYLFKKGDVAALTSAIRIGLQAADGKGTAAREQARKKFEIRSIVEQYEALYDRILKNH